MIVTVYKKDGTKERRPVGYVGGACGRATEPYEQREIAGQMKKTPTPESNECEPVSIEQRIGQKQ